MAAERDFSLRSGWAIEVDAILICKCSGVHDIVCVDASITLINHLKDLNRFKRAGLRYHHCDIVEALDFKNTGFEVVIDKVQSVAKCRLIGLLQLLSLNTCAFSRGHWTVSCVVIVASRMHSI